MRSRMSIVHSGQARQWALDWLVLANLLKGRGRICTPTTVWSIVLRAASRAISIYAACQDLAEAPSGQAVFNSLVAGLPKTLRVLEGRLNESLTAHVPRRLLRRQWQVAIDWHLVPYYGEPFRSRNELYHCRPMAGTTKFHTYATACIVEQGHRYTVATTWVRKHESTTTVLRRLLATIRNIGWKIKRLLLDRAFFSADVAQLLQQERLPFLIPVALRGRKPKKRRPPTGLRFIQRQKAGWYSHTLKRGDKASTVEICVAYRSYYRPGENKRRTQKLLFAAWRVNGSPTQIRDTYRNRFAIESSYRQRRQARIYTCTPNPHLRLVFVVVSLLLRNLWVWIHAQHLKTRTRRNPALQLHLLPFKRLLEWINLATIVAMHDGTQPCINDS